MGKLEELYKIFLRNLRDKIDGKSKRNRRKPQIFRFLTEKIFNEIEENLRG